MLKRLITLVFITFYFIQPIVHAADTKPAPAKEEIVKVKTILSEKDVQQVLSRLTDEDKNSLKQIQDQVSTWPKEVFEEIRAYKNFVIEARKKAEALYTHLSDGAKEAMKLEQNLKSTLSPNALAVLTSIELQK